MSHCGPGQPEDHRESASLVRGAGVILTGHVTGRILAICLTLLLTHMLGAEDYGLYLLGLSILQSMVALTDLGMRPGLLRFVPLAVGRGDPGEARSVAVRMLRYGFVAGTVGALILALLTPNLVELLREPSLMWLVPAFAISLPLVTFGGHLKSALQALKRMKAVAALENVVDPLTRILVFSLLAALGFGVMAAVGAFTAAAVVVCALGVYWLVPRLPKPGKSATPIPTAEILAFSIPLGIAQLATMSMRWADSLFLGYFSTALDIGVYGAAARAATIGGMLLVAANASFGPHANELYGRHDMRGVGRLYQQVTRWMIILNIPVLAGLVVFAPWILRLFGAEFSAGSAALVILAVGTFVSAATGPAGGIVLMSGRSKVVLWTGIALASLNISLHIVLIPKWGIVGAAAATGGTVAIANILNVILGWRLMDLQPYDRRILRPLAIAAVASLLTVAVAITVGMSSVVGVCFFLLIWAVAYPIAVLRVAIDPSDTAVFYMLLRRNDAR